VDYRLRDDPGWQVRKLAGASNVSIQGWS
jgi:hypothetical protein